MKSIALFIFAMFSVSYNSFSATNRGKYFDHVIFVVFENKNYTDIFRQPFFKQLSNQGAHFTNFMAITHPSQGNYIALTSGSLNGVKNDQPVDLNVRNVADLLESQGLTWKVYAENYPGNCFLGASKGLYARKHNPFISYINIQKNSARCANIVDAQQFDRDAANNNLPNYIFYVPNMNNDGHDTDSAYADKWYQGKFGSYVKDTNFMKNTILVSTFDESDVNSSKNQIYTSIVGGPVKPGNVSAYLNTYSLLMMIEDNWGLGNLNKEDSTAPSLPNIWR